MTQDSKYRTTEVFNILAIIIAGLVLTLPAILYGLPAGHDGRVHVARYEDFASQLWSGELYPRWLLGMNGGLGSPVFFFYGPIPFYIASLFYIAPKELHGWYQLGLACSLAAMASGLATYLWLRDVAVPKAALVAAILYMAMPYPLAVDFYHRAAIGEYWAFIWMPLILYFTRRLASGNKPALIGIAVTYAALIMTHVLIALIFSIIPVAYMVLLAHKEQRVKACLGTIASLALGIGLSAIYLLPAIAMRDSIDYAYKATPDVERNFLFANSYVSILSLSPADFVTFISQVAVVTVGVAFTGFSLARGKLSSYIGEENYFWCFVVILSLCMMLPIAGSLWSTLPVLHTIQFPWRFSTILSLGTAALIALGVFSLGSSFTRFHWIHVVVASLLVVSWVLPTIKIVNRRFADQRPSAEMIQLINSKMDSPAMRPRWMKHDLFDPAFFEKVSRSFAQASIVTGEGSVSIEKWKPREIVLRTEAPSDTWLAVNQFYYTGWTARLLNGSLSLPVRPSEDYGLLNVRIPGGTHRVFLNLDGGNPERIGQALSAVFVVIIIFLALWFQLPRSKARWLPRQ